MRARSLTHAGNLTVAARNSDLNTPLPAIRVSVLRGVGDKLGNEQGDADGAVGAHEQFVGSVAGDIAVRRCLGEIATNESEIFAAGVETKIRVKLIARNAPVFAGREHEQKLPGLQGHGRENPLRWNKWIIREMPAREVHGKQALILQFYPV